ncbi:hypothetical protein [Chromobacterium sp. Panama]|uniref:hypothetical protein n=1 Tax=Chromobacterium sp. Panama TaxID=2161826 RepID=UPI0011B27280|nr:hypothetical protein [Chromobacterium sp. Panama]
MHNSLVTTASRSPQVMPREVVLSSTSVAVSDLLSPRMAEIMRVLPATELRNKMRRPAVPHAAELRKADPETKIQALSSFSGAYLPLAETLTFTSQVLAKTREVYRAKQFGCEEFRRYFHATAEVLHGERLRPLPVCLSSITDTGFWLTGPSLMGRTATLRRLVEILGRPFLVEGEHPAPRCMWVIPVLYLTYPTCGTLQGMLRDMRERVLSVIGGYDTDINALSDIEGWRGQNVAIAICTLLNVGLVVLDGGGFANVNGHTAAILQFLLKLRQHTGIPVLISGTSAFMYCTSFMGTTASNLVNGPGLHLDPIPKPAPLVDGVVPKARGVWRQVVTWLWQEGVLPEHCEMPAALPEWVYGATFGRFGWLVQGFRALHVTLVTTPEMQQPGHLTEDAVRQIFERALQLHTGARSAIARTQEVVSGKGKLAVLKNLDHLPAALFEKPQVHEWLDEAILSRI